MALETPHKKKQPQSSKQPAAAKLLKVQGAPVRGANCFSAHRGKSEFELDLRAVQGPALNLSRDAVSDETSGSVMRFQTFLFLFGHGRAHARLARNTRPSLPQKRI